MRTAANQGLAQAHSFVDLTQEETFQFLSFYLLDFPSDPQVIVFCALTEFAFLLTQFFCSVLVDGYGSALESADQTEKDFVLAPQGFVLFLLD